MKNNKTNYLNRAMLCILIFLIALLCAHQHIDRSIDYIIKLSDQCNDDLHILLVFLIPAYLAIIIFGFGILSVYCASKIDHFFDG